MGSSRQAEAFCSSAPAVLLTRHPPQSPGHWLLAALLLAACLSLRHPAGSAMCNRGCHSPTPAAAVSAALGGCPVCHGAAPPALAGTWTWQGAATCLLSLPRPAPWPARCVRHNPPAHPPACPPNASTCSLRSQRQPELSGRGQLRARRLFRARKRVGATQQRRWGDARGGSTLTALRTTPALPGSGGRAPGPLTRPRMHAPQLQARRQRRRRGCGCRPFGTLGRSSRRPTGAPPAVWVPGPLCST